MQKIFLLKPGEKSKTHIPPSFLHHTHTASISMCEEILMSTNGSAASYISCTPDTCSHVYNGYVVHVVINILKTEAHGPINTLDGEVWPL